MKESESLLEWCLFFIANSLSRAIPKRGGKACSWFGMASSCTFLPVAVVDNPGIVQKELIH